MIIRNGTIIDTVANTMYKADLYIENGSIFNILRNDADINTAGILKVNIISNVGGQAENQISGQRNYMENVIDATGLLIGPGLIDTHVHFRDPGFTHKEDIFTGAEAAKAGGYTGIVLMANTNPKVDNADTLKYVIDKGSKTGINIYTCANVTMNMAGKELTDMETLIANGAVGVTDDGIPLVNEDIALEAMHKSAILHKPISFHEENPDLISENGINRGKASEYYGIEGSPREAEISLIERDIKLMEKCSKIYGVMPTVVIQHISTKEGVNLVRKAKEAGLDIHAEATPHHFSLTEEAVIKYGAMAKMNPPLRTEEDRMAIIEGIKDGTIDLIATDHAPHTNEEKSGEITKTPSGIIGLETALNLGITELINKNGMGYPMLFERMSANPARLYDIEGGQIKEGLPANFVIFDPRAKDIKNEFHSKSSNSPFVGMELDGKIIYTICNGEIVYQS
ncbi:MAG: dihydroorotase [Lachnospiraceae bacterium]|nr:dihydroorotase [Lachnospiraceae bacterium]